MRLMVLDKDFNTLGAIPLFITLIWIRRYKKVGCFELYVAKEYFELLNSGSYLYRTDANELGVLDEVNYSQDKKGSREAYAKGNFAEVLLSRRVVNPTFIGTGNAEQAMRNLVTINAISPSDPDRVITHLRLGETSGILAEVNFQSTGDNLSDKLYDVGNTLEISHRVRYEYLTNDLVFEVWQGKDRRDSQSVNSWAVFSNSFYNILDVVYNRSDASYKNFAFVAGAGEGTERTIVTVDLRIPGEERREIWVDARDLQPTDAEGAAIDMDTYKQQLYQRGLEKLAEYCQVETVNSSVDHLANLVYKKDFDLGDLCTYINTEIGVSTEKRITEIMETYEGATTEITVTFGDDDVQTIKQLIKREAG